MQKVLAGQANICELPIVAKASGSPIISGTINFYLVARDGTNADKWYKGSDGIWYASEQIAGVATHRADGHWYLSLPSAVWIRNVAYTLYGKESNDLHIPVQDSILCVIQDLDIIVKAWCAGNWILKSGETNVYELLDADDGVTPVLEMTLSQTTPYRSITIL